MDNNPTTRLSSPDQNARIDENATISNINTVGGTPEAPSSSGTTTMTITQDATPLEAPVLRLTLRPQPHVSWNADVINNEGLGRKSSKRCCIFHKARAFGESSTESSEDDSGDDGSTSSSSSGGGGSGKARRPLVKKKSKKKGVVGKSKVPDYQRFHA